jgi:hypothetical protein
LGAPLFSIDKGVIITLKKQTMSAQYQRINDPDEAEAGEGALKKAFQTQIQDLMVPMPHHHIV